MELFILRPFLKEIAQCVTEHLVCMWEEVQDLPVLPFLNHFFSFDFLSFFLTRMGPQGFTSEFQHKHI